MIYLLFSDTAASQTYYTDRLQLKYFSGVASSIWNMWYTLQYRTVEVSFTR